MSKIHCYLKVLIADNGNFLCFIITITLQKKKKMSKNPKIVLKKYKNSKINVKI